MPMTDDKIGKLTNLVIGLSIESLSPGLEQFIA